jgi:2-keto-4-pentenoate hydratase/2-oxohepta-3-ene-1,7-dioic acid hydratase in catechol pathway
MRLVTYQHGSAPPRIGLVDDGAIVDLAKLAPALPSDMITLLSGGAETLRNIQRLHADRLPTDRLHTDRPHTERPHTDQCAPTHDAPLPIESVRLLAPIPSPPTYLGVGLNYREHAKEAGLAFPTAPLIFNKQTSCINGPYDDVLLPRESQQLDFEGELGIVIGRATRNMSSSEAAEAIAGYVVTNDFSVRDWQLSSPTHTLGKSFDTHGPIGPWLVTADEVPDPQNLLLSTTVDGELRQSSSTADMIFSCLDIVRFLSRFMTLPPATLITTGTPAGVCFGRKPPVYLQPGALVTVQISHIGRIANRVIAESSGQKT